MRPYNPANITPKDKPYSLTPESRYMRDQFDNSYLLQLENKKESRLIFTEPKRSPSHKSNNSMDEFSLKPPLPKHSKPSHKRTISGNQAYFSGLSYKNLEIEIDNSHKTKSPLKTAMHSGEINLTNIKEIEEKLDMPRLVSQESEDEANQEALEFQNIIHMIVKEDEKSKHAKAENLRKIKNLLLESMNKEGNFESDLFGREDMISTASSKTQNGLGSFLMQDTLSSTCNSKAIFKCPEENSIFKPKPKGHCRRKSENNLM